MSNTLTDAAEVEPLPFPGGVLDKAIPVPEGWAQGLSIPFYGCGEPKIQDRCLASNDEPYRTSVAEFYPFGISQGATCSTLSRLDQSKHAEGRLESTTEWAVGRQLAVDIIELGNVSFEDGVSLGVVSSGNFTLAVATLEQAAADAGFGTVWWLHAPIKAGAFLKSEDLVDLPSKAPWIMSPGYPVEGPTTIRLWVTGPVWAGVDDPFVVNDIYREGNEDTAFAMRNAIVAFDPCINFYIDVTVPASPAVGSA